MRIPKGEWGAMEISTPINKWKTWGFVRGNYCDPMTARGLCPRKCWECEDRLRNAIEPTVRRGVDKPVGLLIWVLKEAVAIAQEEYHPEEPVKRDRYEPQVDPFDKFLEDLL